MSDRRDILLIGAGGHARSCIDVVEEAGFRIVGLVGVDTEMGLQTLGYRVLGTDADLPTLRTHAALALVTIGQLDTAAPRMTAIAAASAAGFTFPAIVSPHAHVSRHAVVGEGSIVMNGAIINAGANIGRHCIVNSQALIEHDAAVGDFCHISTASVLNGGVRVGQRCFVGSASVVRQYLEIGSDCFIAMGSVVRKDVINGGRVKGRD
jgi:sugar O-acyltransferase (sialic acid O-acetyltransferase NeuD family)